MARTFANALELAMRIFPSRASCQTGDEATPPFGVTQLRMPTRGSARNRSISSCDIVGCVWGPSVDIRLSFLERPASSSRSRARVARLREAGDQAHQLVRLHPPADRH